MHFKKLFAIGLVMVSISSTIPLQQIYAKENFEVSTLLSCKEGDTLKITLDDKSVNWNSTNEEIAKSKNNKVEIVGSGECIIYKEDKQGKEYAIKIKSEGKSLSSAIIELECKSNEDILSLPIKKESNNITVVEVNENILGSEKNPEIKIDGFDSIEGEDSVKAVEEGVYVLDNMKGVKSSGDKSDLKATEVDTKVVKVVKPKLNKEVIEAVVGQKDTLTISDNIKMVSCSSTDESVAVVNEEGNVTIVGKGECDIKVNTPNNELICHVKADIPTVDTKEVILRRDETYQIQVEGNLANLPVSYSCSEGGTVTKDGIVSVETGSECNVQINIGDNISYTKHFRGGTINEELWQEMQPAIKECLGTPYVFGGVTPKVGIDCSAYVSYVYKSVGLVTGRYTAQGLYDLSTEVKEPQPGDLIFFHSTYDTDDYVTHVGIYTGDGMMYHSGEPNQKASFETPYWQKHLIGFGTLIKE